MTQRSAGGSRPVTKDEFDRLEKKVDEVISSQKALLDAWTTANNMLKFVRIVSTIAAALSAVWMFFSHGKG